MQWFYHHCTTFLSFQVKADKLKVCVIRAKVDGESPLALNNRRLIVEDKLQSLSGVQFFLSTVSGYKNARDGSNTFWTGFFVAVVPGHDTAGDFLFNAIHDAGLLKMADPGKTSLTEQLCILLKDHNNSCVKVCLQYFRVPFPPVSLHLCPCIQGFYCLHRLVLLYHGTYISI